MRFWNASNGSLERTIAVSGDKNGELSFIGPDGRTGLWLEYRTNRTDLHFVDLLSGAFIGQPHELPLGFFDAVFSPKGQYVALLDRLGPVKILENRTGRLISSWIRHPGELEWLHWDLDDQRLLTAGESDEVLLWDIRADARPLRALRTPGATTRTARWSADSRFIVGVGSDYKVRVWDSTNGEIITALEHAWVLAAAAILSSGRLITLSYTGDAEIRAWDLIEAKLSVELLIDYAQYLSGRRLDSAGSMVPLTPGELADLDRSLHQRAPHLFQ